MSQGAMLQAVRDRIQAIMAVDANSCEVGFDGKPKPAAGEVYYAVHPGEWRATPSGDDDLDETIGVKVTVTRKLSATPMDRYGKEVFVKASTGMEPLCRQIIKAIHLNYSQVMNVANTTYIASAGPNFTEPLKFADGGTPTPQNADWFSGVMPDVGGNFAGDFGVSQTLTFSGARLVTWRKELAGGALSLTGPTTVDGNPPLNNTIAFVCTRDSTGGSVSCTLAISGTAILGTDYSLPGSMTFTMAATVASATITLSRLPLIAIGGTVIGTLTHALGGATIGDNDSATVTIGGQ